MSKALIRVKPVVTNTNNVLVHCELGQVLNDNEKWQIAFFVLFLKISKFRDDHQLLFWHGYLEPLSVSIEQSN